MSKELLEDLLIEFDEMGFEPTTLCDTEREVESFRNRLKQVLNYLKAIDNTKPSEALKELFRIDGNITYLLSGDCDINEEVDMNLYNLDSGDLILMSSDGIFENIENTSDFESFINSIKNYPPQRIVYEILNYTLSHKIKAKDDMSIIALKIQSAA